MTLAVLTWCNNITRSSYIITDLGGALDWKARHSYQFPGPPSQVPARLEGLEKATWQEVESDCTGGFLARDVVHNKTRLLGWHTTRLKLRAKLNHVSSQSLLKPMMMMMMMMTMITWLRIVLNEYCLNKRRKITSPRLLPLECHGLWLEATKIMKTVKISL